MIRIHFKITWPLLIALLISLLIWLIRDSGQRQAKPAPAQIKPSTARRSSPRPTSAQEPVPPIEIIMPEKSGQETPGDPDESLSYNDALRSGRYSADELAAIGNREAAQRGHEAYQQASADDHTHYDHLRATLRRRGTQHVNQ